MKNKKPDCYKCVHCLPCPGDAHKRCNNTEAKVSGNPHGIRMGWFLWPFNFDPSWLEECDGFSDDPEDKLPYKNSNPLIEIAALMGKRYDYGN